MKILSIETSSEICSVAVLEDREVLAEITIEDGNTHSVKLMPQIEQLLEKINLTIQDIDVFACDKGPGSFTGIRIGIATIKAFCDVTNKLSIGISSLLGLAYNIKETGYICSLIDAKHDMVYAGLYDNRKGNYELIGEERADNIQNVTEMLKKDNKKITFVGNGSIVYRDMIESNLKEMANFLSQESKNKLNATSIGMAAFEEYSNVKENTLTPLYLRKSNAEREREEKQNATNH